MSGQRVTSRPSYRFQIRPCQRNLQKSCAHNLNVYMIFDLNRNNHLFSDRLEYNEPALTLSLQTNKEFSAKLLATIIETKLPVELCDLLHVFWT